MAEYKEIISKTKLIELIKNNGPKAKELIEAKGFHFGYDEIYEKIALLHTEVAELSDAVKKGKGKEEEGSELADIIIRLLNIPCLIPEIYNAFDEMQIDEYMNISYDVKNDIQCKYLNSVNMHSAISKLGESIARYKDLENKGNNLKTNDNREIFAYIMSSLYMVACFMLSIVSLCEFYNAKFLGKNLQDLIDEKMRKNWERPYRYNTSAEHFQ